MSGKMTARVGRGGGRGCSEKKGSRQDRDSTETRGRGGYQRERGELMRRGLEGRTLAAS